MSYSEECPVCGNSTLGDQPGDICAKCGFMNDGNTRTEEQLEVLRQTCQEVSEFGLDCILPAAHNISRGAHSSSGGFMWHTWTQNPEDYIAALRRNSNLSQSYFVPEGDSNL